MKKLIIASLMILLLPIFGFSQFTHLGIDAGYSSQVKEPGFGLYGIFRVNDEIKLTPNFQYYLPNKVTTNDGPQEFQWYTVNLDGNYIIVNQGVFEGYGLMGLNFSVVQGKETIPPAVDTYNQKFNKAGLNVGGGFRFNISDKVVPFAEVRYTIGGKINFVVNEVSTSQFGIFAGILIRITEDKDRSVSEDY